VRIGLLGGTFNPPHLGHLVCAQEAYLQLELDRVLVLPAHVPPHKAVDDEPGVEHRVELCRQAIAGDDRFEICELEVKRPGPSYTVDTLEELHSTVQDSELYLIVGGDIAAGLPEWREPQRVLSLASLAVADRQGTPRAAIDSALALVAGGSEVRFFSMPQIAVSSTMVRDRTRAGRPIRYLVPDDVANHIEHHRLYRDVPATEPGRG
jgi:nicotinate-nucleotide adenylyltransferase